MLKAQHVIPSIREEASGPSYSVPRLCQELVNNGAEVQISCIDAGRKIPGVEVKEHHEWPFTKPFAVSTQHLWHLKSSASDFDIVHNHSLWSMVNIGPGFIVPKSEAALVVSPRGTLSEWSLNRRKYLKRLLSPLQYKILSKADLIHVTSQEEYVDIRRLGFKAPVAIIPNGVDVNSTLTPVKHSGKRRVLFLSRIHPKKGIDLLLHAWSRIERNHDDFELIFAGKGEPDHERDYIELSNRLGLKQVKFVGPVYGNEKSELFQTADVFVLPSHSENFGLAAAEALAHGVPAILSKNMPFSDLNKHRCGWWVDNDLSTLSKALDTAMSISKEELQQMGARGKMWMESRYSWHSIGQKMVRSYEYVLNGGGRPKWILNS